MPGPNLTSEVVGRRSNGNYYIKGSAAKAKYQGDIDEESIEETGGHNQPWADRNISEVMARQLAAGSDTFKVLGIFIACVGTPQAEKVSYSAHFQNSNSYLVHSARTVRIQQVLRTGLRNA